MEILARNITFLRLRDELTLEQVAHKLGLKSKSNIKAYEKGTCYPKADNLLKIAELFDVSLDTLVKTDLSKGEISWEENFKAEIMSRIKKLERKCA